MGDSSFFKNNPPVTYTTNAGGTPNATNPVNNTTAKSSFFEAAGGQYTPTPGFFGVSTIFGRTGVVTAAFGDYTFSQLASTPVTMSGYGITDKVGAVAYLGLRVRLLAATTYNVATTGNDSTGDGSVGLPWLTIQKALNFVHNNVDLNGFTVTIQVGSGTFAGFEVYGPFVDSGNGAALNTAPVTVVGDAVTPANVTINTAVVVYYSAVLGLSGLNIAPTAANGLQVSRSATVILVGNCTFGGTVSSHIAITQAALLVVLVGYTISSGASQHISLVNNGVLICQPITVTTAGTPAFTVAFISATKCSTSNTAGITFSGTGATGVRYSVQSNAVVDTGGGGANYFPGNGAGSTVTGGQYL